MRDFASLVKDAESQPFSGWDFSFLADRMDVRRVSWNYKQRILSHLGDACSMLDMGTGGGEFLASLQPLPQDTCATEAYLPNVDVAKRTLDTLGVHVAYIESDEHLPFEDNRFDLIINRHEAYSPQEVYRILKPGGRFITQQVGGKNNIQLNERLGGPLNSEFSQWNLDYAVHECQNAGLQVVTRKEEFPETKFLDVGAVVFFLRVIEWQLPGFTVERYGDRLVSLHEEIEQNGSFSARSHRFYMEAVKD